MELFIAIFIGVWMCAASVVSYFRLKKEFNPYLDKAEGSAIEQGDLAADIKEGDR